MKARSQRQESVEKITVRRESSACWANIVNAPDKSWPQHRAGHNIDFCRRRYYPNRIELDGTVVRVKNRMVGSLLGEVLSRLGKDCEIQA
jgi:hypothetical protein